MENCENERNLCVSRVDSCEHASWYESLRDYRMIAPISTRCYHRPRLRSARSLGRLIASCIVIIIVDIIGNPRVRKEALDNFGGPTSRREESRFFASRFGGFGPATIISRRDDCALIERIAAGGNAVRKQARQWRRVLDARVGDTDVALFFFFSSFFTERRVK